MFCTYFVNEFLILCYAQDDTLTENPKSECMRIRAELLYLILVAIAALVLDYFIDLESMLQNLVSWIRSRTVNSDH